MGTIFCPWESSQYFIFSANVPQILYYAMVPGMLVALVLGLFVFFSDKKFVAARVLMFIAACFFVWGLLNLVLFATNNPQTVIVLWSYVILVEPMIYAGSLYLAYVFIDKRDISFSQKAAIAVLLSPFILALATPYNLSGVRVSDCTAIEGFVALYVSYAVEIVFAAWILMLAVHRYRRADDPAAKRQIGLFTFGILFFLLTFSSGNIIGSFTSDWVASQYGYFGMPIFIGFLTYLIVEYKAFDTKLIRAQALVATLLALIGSMLFFVRNSVNRILTIITLLLTAVFGWQLIKSVKREIKQREQLQVLTEELKTANEQLATANVKLKQLDQAKTEFLSITSHQLRTPLTGIKGYLSMMLEGDFGKFVQEQTDVLTRVSAEVDRLARMVQVFLNVSRIESGRLIIGRVETNLVEIAMTVVKELTPLAEKKKLQLSYAGPPVFNAVVDPDKLKDVIMNLIDNSIKYTTAGSIHVKVEGTEAAAQVTVQDTGLGIDPGEAARLFEKFSRGIGVAKVSAEGTGLGLFIVKKIVEAHGGKVWAESMGKGKGSAFIFTVPVKPPEEGESK
jgi:signal transduction histidine kinase